MIKIITTVFVTCLVAGCSLQPQQSSTADIDKVKTTIKSENNTKVEGKTESAKSISKTLGGELVRIQFSMMQTNEAYNYLFGSEHSKSSFARDMMSRESNVILVVKKKLKKHWDQQCF